MANQEACELWIEQRIEEEQQKGTAHPEIGRIVGAEIVKLFEARIEARTIEQRSRRVAATNVATRPTPESSNENQDNQVSEEMVSDVIEVMANHGGHREGAGAPTKNQPDTIKDKEFLQLHKDLKKRLRYLKANEWEEAPRGLVLDKLQELIHITITA